MYRKPRILFFSTGNATRSQMAAAFLPLAAGDEVVGASTAVQSTEIDPLAAEVLSEVGVALPDRPAKPVAQSLKENFACVVTLSDDSKERSPIWPFTRRVVHWNLKDPAAVDAPSEQRRDEFRRVRDEIRRNVEQLADAVATELQKTA